MGWVPGFRTHILAHAAGVGWLSWLLSGVPVVGQYVEWDWWDDIQWELKFRKAWFRALGIVFVPLVRTLLILGVVRAAEREYAGASSHPDVLVPARDGQAI